MIARLCAAADASTLKKAVANLVNQVGDENKLLAVTALGELGRRCDLSKLGAISTLATSATPTRRRPPPRRLWEVVWRARRTSWMVY